MSEVEQVPWRNPAPSGAATFYVGQNQPEAVVLHRMQGYIGTARQWAREGHYGASWHYTIGYDGTILQHLSYADGGYHAGIVATAPQPVWPLWKGPSVNVNLYTIGVECEGFAGGDWPEAQLASLRWLCRKLAADLAIPYDHDHFPAHAEIDVVNRVNDFDTPDRRPIVYDYLFETEEDMTDDDLLAIFSGKEEASLSREERLTNARYRRDEAAAGRAPSIRDLAASAYANAGGATARIGTVESLLSAHTMGHIGAQGVTADDIANAITGGAKFAADGIRFAAQRGSGG